MAKKRNTVSLTIKVIIMSIIFGLGIFYILKKPPTSEVANFKKSDENMPQHFFGKNNVISRFLSSDKEQEVEGDAVSLTGKAGKYEESRIGK